MPYDNERTPEEEDKKEKRKKKKVAEKPDGPDTKNREEYMFDPKPLKEGEPVGWEK